MNSYLSPRSLLFAVVLAAAGCGGSGGPANSSPGNFAQTKLVADNAGQAAVTDAHLVNAWGIAFSPKGPFWVSDNGTGVVSTYNGAGAIQPIVVQIPAAGGGANGPVSGQVYNATGQFAIQGSGPSIFIFVNEDGLVSAWNGGANATVEADRSATGAVYKGVAIASSGGANFLYATNFHAGVIDVFDSNFKYLRSFTDTQLPSDYGPFGITTINNLVYVTFAKHRPPDNHDDLAGPGNGFVDVFNPDGTRQMRLASHGPLNSPWGLALAPTGFGNVGGDLLVSNFGDGRINAFDPSSGAFEGALNDANGKPLVVQGIWGIAFGNGGKAGATGTLYFTAGPNAENDGLFGSLAPTTSSGQMLEKRKE